MRKELGKALKEVFTRSMAAELPRFRETPVKSMYLNPGERVFEWAPGGAKRLFVLLVPHPKGGDQFTVELGWSTLGRFPELGMRPSRLPPMRSEEFREAEYICRLGEAAGGSDKWWSLERSAAPAVSVAGALAALQAQVAPLPAAEARALVQEPVAEAMGLLQRSGVPYLEAWLEQAGKPA